MAGDWKKNPAVGFTLTVVILIALFIAIKGIMPKKYSYIADLKCDSCGNVFEKKLTTGIKLPVKCQKCGKANAYRAIKCQECGEIFTMKPPPMPARGQAAPPMPMMDMPKCPKCGSMKLGVVTQRTPPAESK